MLPSPTPGQVSAATMCGHADTKTSDTALLASLPVLTVSMIPRAKDRNALSQAAAAPLQDNSRWLRGRSHPGERATITTFLAGILPRATSVLMSLCPHAVFMMA